MATTASPEPKIAYGPRVDLEGLPDLFEPQTVMPYTPPPAGIDNLGISSLDVFNVPGVGEFTVEFQGYVRVARSEPTTSDWVTSEVYTNLIEMRMEGEHPELGAISVTLNSDCLSTGQIRTPFTDETAAGQPAKACRMAVGAVFSLPKLGLTLYNREPVILTIDDVRSIPPAGNPGKGQIYRMLPLYDRSNPDGAPVAYLTSLQFRMGTYLPDGASAGAGTGE
jgi:hypothetical protein